jgi:Tol biopolymer transport system component
VDGEHGQERTLLRASERDDPAVDPYLEGAEDGDLHAASKAPLQGDFQVSARRAADDDGVRRLSLVAFVFLALSPLAAAPALGTAPGKNGTIVYALFPTLWVVNPDGTGERKFPHIARSEDAAPDWSPDGTKIAFARCADKCEIWAVRADGTGAKRIGPNCLRRPDDSCFDRGTPSWSPDGRRLAFGQGSGLRDNRVKDPEIHVMNADGTGVRRVTSLSAGRPYAIDLFWPIWSPDGKQLVFEVQHFATADPPNRRALFVVNVDGSGLRQLTPWSLNAGGRPDWSPDGRLILFRTVSPTNRHHGNLYTIRPDGTGLRKLTSYPAPKTVLNGSFSPDGKWIAFSRFSDTPYPAVYVMRSDGTGVRRVTRNVAVYDLDWGPRRR